MSNNWLKVGTLRKSKTGSLYVKVDEGVTLTKGDVLQLQDPRKKLQASVEAGRLSQEAAAEKAAKIPDYIRYEVVKPPTEAKG